MSIGRGPLSIRQLPHLDGREDPIPLDSRRSSRRTRRAARVGALALLAAVALAPAGCVSKAQYTQVEQERDLCTTRYEELRNQVESANRACETLAQEKTALATEKTALEAKVATLQTQEEDARKLQTTYDDLVVGLKKELKAGQVEVQQLRDRLRVNVAQDMLFESGSALLDENGTAVLGKVATQLKKSSHQILVIGHTDNKPIGPALVKQYPTNWELAGARAASVVRLFAQSGLSNKRLLAVSMADTQPVPSNKTEEGRAKNRRIEIRLRPVKTEG